MVVSGKSKGNGDLDTVVLRHESGATAEVYLFGATLTSYKTADGKERIFCSPAAIFDGTKAIRGGVPLVFPQFGQPDKALPQHGVARISTWSLDELNDLAEASVAKFSLVDSPETKEKWNHCFKLEFTVALTSVSLNMTLRVLNSGDAPFNFSCLLHTYLKIPDIATTCVHGLAGRTYVDKVAGGEKKKETNTDIDFPSFTDRIYVGEAPLAKDVVVKSGETGLCAVVNEALINGTPKAVDVVIWNPYEEASPGDLPPPAYKEFVCVEPGLVDTTHELASGSVATLSQKLIPM